MKVMVVMFLFTLFVTSLGAPPLSVLKTTTTPNGFHSAARGWNSYGLQLHPPGTTFTYNQANVESQCDVLASSLGGASSGFVYCSLDSGWSVGDHGDEYGRIIADPSLFDMPSLASHLHSKGLKLGVYILPGAFCKDANKLIYGTNIPINTTLDGHNNGFARCDFNFNNPNTQLWHNSVVDLFASWGVDFIKLDYITPGSPDNGGNLPKNNSGSVIAYHNAITRSKRQMRLDISWKLERNVTYYDIWRANADTMRTDQDINNGGGQVSLSWATVQRAIENYRQYIMLQVPKNQLLSIYPDLDNLYVGNPIGTSGVTDLQRQTIMTHWIGAATNLIVGSDLHKLDAYGVNLLTNKRALEIADFCASYPMQPRNPGTGLGLSKQLQAWIAGPSGMGEVVVVLANYGPDLGQGGFGTQLKGIQDVTVTLEDLGISGKSYQVLDVWANMNKGTTSQVVSAKLGEGESVLFKLTLA